jgi:hypothetical protein
VAIHKLRCEKTEESKMHKSGTESAGNRDRRNFLIRSLGLGSGVLLYPRLFTGTLSGQEGPDESTNAALNEEALALWSNRLVGSPSATKGDRPQPDEAAFFYYTKDKGFMPVELETDDQSDLGQLLPATSTNMKLGVNVVRPNREHFRYIARNKNGTLAVSIMPFADTAPAKSGSAGEDSAKPGDTSSDPPSDHLISSVLPPPPAFDYHVSYPTGPSLVTNGAPMHAGFGNWAWTFTVQEKPPAWQAFMTDLQTALGGQTSSSTASHASTTQPAGTKPPATSNTTLAQLIKFVEGGVGAWETLSFLGVGVKVLNSVLGKTMAQTGKPNVLLTLPNRQVVTSKAGRQTAAGSALPLLQGEYVAVPLTRADVLRNAGKTLELYEGVIVPAGSKDTRAALSETLLPGDSEPDPGLTYVSFSVKFS